MEQFTAIEVRATIAANRDGVTDQKMEMLYAYADLLEAREKAEPYGYVSGNPIRENAGSLVVSMPEADFKTPVYIHPAPVYAISRSMHSYYTQDEEEARQAEFDGANVQRIPAQPPAASVTDGFVFERVNMGRGNERYVGLADGSEGTTVQEDGDGPGDTRSRLLWRIADAALAAQEDKE